MPFKYQRLTPLATLFAPIEAMTDSKAQFVALQEFIRTQRHRNLDELHLPIHEILIKCLLASKEHSEHRDEICDFIIGDVRRLRTGEPRRPDAEHVIRKMCDVFQERGAHDDIGAIIELILRLPDDDEQKLPLKWMDYFWKRLPRTHYRIFGAKLKEYGDFLEEGRLDEFIDKIKTKFRIEFETAKLDTRTEVIFEICEMANLFVTREGLLWIMMARTTYVLLAPRNFGWRYAMTLAQVGFSPDYEHLSENQERIEPLIDFLYSSLATPPNFVKIELAVQCFANFATLSDATRAKFAKIIANYEARFGELVAILSQRIETCGDYRDCRTMENLRKRLISLINWETLVAPEAPSFGTRQQIVSEQRIERFFEHAERGAFFYEQD